MYKQLELLPSQPKHLDMALEKLAIRGIRSFDNNRVEVIQFFSPVTVIVGHNGSGKTVSTKLFI